MTRQTATWRSSEVTSAPSTRDGQWGWRQSENQGLCGLSVGLAVSSPLRGWGGCTAQTCSQALRPQAGGRVEQGAGCTTTNTLLDANSLPRCQLVVQLPSRVPAVKGWSRCSGLSGPKELPDSSDSSTRNDNVKSAFLTAFSLLLKPQETYFNLPLFLPYNIFLHNLMVFLISETMKVIWGAESFFHIYLRCNSSDF